MRDWLVSAGFFIICVGEAWLAAALFNPNLNSNYSVVRKNLSGRK